MFKLRKSEERGRINMGWLDTYHTFSFGQYYDPQHMHFRHLRVINQDRLLPNSGFPLHPHNDMEIISYIFNGTIEHQDSMGNSTQIKKDEVQVMSAGTGIQHSEHNPSTTEDLELLQIWILPDKKGHTPRYDQKLFTPESKNNQLKLIVSQDGRDESLQVHQDVSIFASQLAANNELTFTTQVNRFYWVQLIEGKLQINDQTLDAGDGLSVAQANELNFKSQTDSHFLLFELC